MDSMSRNLNGMVSLLAALALAGCVSSQHTRLPTLSYNRPDVERKSYEYFDPAPDRDAGPAIDRPPGMEIQRSEPRRSREAAGNQTASGTRSGLRPSAAKYPNSVVQ
ncbi:MAG TPA: hypothetical protein DDY91_21205 [Planctomycetaceae bacterium]|jgi:hypothetical protein|nr:hypothetical protein [Planctomycetaceae bacterium]